jgi:hypothetical protein
MRRAGALASGRMPRENPQARNGSTSDGSPLITCIGTSRPAPSPVTIGAG